MLAVRPILRGPDLRAIEHLHAKARPTLMERAGAAAATLALQLLHTSTNPPLIVAGPGNNGGDALVVARILKEKGLNPVVIFAGLKEKLPADARAAHDAWLASGGSLLQDIPEGEYALAIDGLFGIGLGERAIEGRYASMVTQLNVLDCPILALDIPSGLDAETGRIMGVCVRATHTATFIALKPGLLTLDGPDQCGAISVHDLDLGIRKTEGSSLAPSMFAGNLLTRRMNTHKGTYGSAGILGGSPGMAGAALLAGRAALKLGAGRVYVGMLQPLALDPLQPELMLRPWEEVFDIATCLAVGPGLGQSNTALALLQRSIGTDLPLLLDADALNLIAAHPVLVRNIARRAAPTLLTPHPAEAARLLGSDIKSIQANRIESTLDLARRFKATTLLKGCGSIVALSDGRWFINTTGNPGLSSAGTGDVLSGIVVALLAQGWPADQALLAAVHLHGAAADACVASSSGPVGLVAGEIIDRARILLNQWIAANRSLHA